ncbi:hypothetical protein [Pseudonocardia sp. GCM10023141]|uniref:hypothetical protein n=1 Tax=Pseudonocardia sp. GCM10023141 TaxID=3252653 RepID=UPI00361DCD4E
MKDIRVDLGNYKLTVVEPPAPKFKQNDNGQAVAAVDREGRQMFVVALFAKQIPAVGERPQKGEEISVTLVDDPGPGIDEGARVVLINPTVSPYRIDSARGVNAGISFKAQSVAPAHAPSPRPDKS